MEQQLPSFEQFTRDKQMMQYPQQNVQQAPQQDPFALSQYRNVNLPDVPMGSSNGIFDSLINNDEVPEEHRKKYWWVFNKDNTLTFLDEKRKNSKLLNFDINKIDILNCMPYYDYNFEVELELDVMRNAFETKLDRAMGFPNGNVKNERITLQSQFTEQRQIQENGSGGNIKEGFFKRLLGRR